MFSVRAIVLAGAIAASAAPLQGQVRFVAPRWSPDGRRIMVVANVENARRYDLYSIGIDGTGLLKLREDARDGSWSPDGSRILFASMSDGDLDVYVMDAQGKDVRRLTNTPEMEYQPVWSPDGSRIAFVSIPPGAAAKHDVHVMNADGTSRRALTQTPADEQVISWATDGRGVAFSSTRDGNWEIYVMNADGDGVRRLTSDSATDAAPAFSPDGRFILFTSNRGGSRRMWRMRADGTEPVPLGNHAGAMMSWSPDGSRIAFVGEADGAAGVFAMNADGTGPNRITPIQAAPVVIERLTPLRWLAGCWELRAAERTTLEMWMPPGGNLMLGASRTTVSGALREWEQLRLSLRGDTVVYTALPSGQSGQKETQFKTMVVSDSGFVVENPAHDFPQRIIYLKRGADSLIARIEGPGQGGTRGINFPMKRVACTAP